MSKPKMISVVLQDGAETELKGILGPWLRSNEFASAYVNCLAIEPNGPYFLMKLQVPDTMLEMEVQIPHPYVKGTLCAADLRKLGFGE
ncbi:hypothetical protein QLQ15_17605 [Lysobacter sp. LF1]|uniref:Uncharacterized protein n=1 Tax=Lysobacter stagni TaxID=3045172 RepID=A0ABT6XKQ2_9GAMM|nr:hypothetical protein [Lysobacter sp. LF1]MDI9240722.1 hypothetical protein [Lysobacter sp. LF1]